ncbi:MAG: redoxin domain-containing protein [Thiohalocapsa sp.]
MHRILAVLFAVFALSSASCADQGAEPGADQGEQFPPAPDFPAGLTWLNVERPLSMQDLRGKVVILDFWTYGCINCIHVMAELEGLRKRFGNKLAVIGVHSPKFENEADIERVKDVLVRYQRAEPVVNDPGHQMMRAYGVRAWPTLAVIDPLGGYVGDVAGEGNEERLARAIDKLLAMYPDAIDETPIALTLGDIVVGNGWFAAPEKIAVGQDRIAVSDSLLNRVLVTDLEGKLLFKIGNDEAGFRDGALAEARFRAPRGLVFAPDGSLYLADTGNHAIRRLDLTAGTVTTIAGTGTKGLLESNESDPLAIDLRSPWDLVLDGDSLYIAMAGEHQIWRMDLAQGKIASFAGSGREGIADGGLKDATFSQPSGLALTDGKLYVADAEASAIREIDLAKGKVRTLVGQGLFDFGDRDGDLADAQLQHAQGVAATADGRVLVADTYNDKLKLLDLERKQVITLLGDGKPGGGAVTSNPRLNEPGGLAVAGNRVLIADTNNGRVLVYDMEDQTTTEWMPQ